MAHRPATPPSSMRRQREAHDAAAPLMEKAFRKDRSLPRSPDRQERTSFSSFKEDRSELAQSFIDSKTSSYAQGYSEEAVVEDPEPDTKALSKLRVASFAAFDGPSEEESMATSTLSMTNPASNLHGFVCPCHGFRGWKEISVKGRVASRSFSDLRMFTKDLTWERPPVKVTPKKSTKNRPGEAPIEKLPIEVLSNIIDYLLLDIPPNGYQPRNMDLVSLLLTSRVMHSVTLATLYSQVTIPHSSIFRKFLAHVADHPALGTIVRRLDFSHFNPTMSGITARERAETPNLTPQTLLKCLKLLPNLREFLAQEHIDEELSTDVIRTLFDMPRLKALDFCACSSASFREAMTSIVRHPLVVELPQILPITRLSFHECYSLPSVVFETLLPRLANLTHLDVTHTRITDEALASIPETARITHLNISKCAGLSGDKVVDLLVSHPAIKDHLVYLNLLMDAKSSEMLDENQVTALLPALPDTLRSLNLKGSKMSSKHVPLLLPLTKHVEELGLGRNLPYSQVLSLVRSPTDEKELAAWSPHTLRYMDISDMDVFDFDFGLVFSQSTSILLQSTMPLEVIEVGQKLYDKLKDREHIFKKFGWVVKEAGRRGWLVRDVGKGESKVDDGARGWKMGATYWGMRKVPVAQAEVGGMYGLYMFKR